MTLFRSKLSKVETYVNTEADKRTPDQLVAAQEEMDRNNADVILVPKTDNIKSASDLQNHLDKLQKDAKDAKAAQDAAEQQVASMKGQRVLPTQTVAPDAGKGGDGVEQEDPRNKEARERYMEQPHVQTAKRLMNNH